MNSFSLGTYSVSRINGVVLLSVPECSGTEPRGVLPYKSDGGTRRTF